MLDKAVVLDHEYFTGTCCSPSSFSIALFSFVTVSDPLHARTLHAPCWMNTLMAQAMFSV